MSVEVIERRIYLIRGVKVMLDSDLADLYQVETFNLNKAVKRNSDRFPEDFMFQLNIEEPESLIFQTGMSKPKGRGGRRTSPYAFTEHGVAMLSSVLNSARAVQMNILIIRAFVKLREMLATHKDLAARIEKLETTQDTHASVINILAEEIDKLTELPPEPPKERIGLPAFQKCHVPDVKEWGAAGAARLPNRALDDPPRHQHANAFRGILALVAFIRGAEAWSRSPRDQTKRFGWKAQLCSRLLHEFMPDHSGVENLCNNLLHKRIA